MKLFPALWLFVFACAGPAQATYLVGETPPDFTLTDTAGQDWTLSDQLGKVVLLNFGQTATVPCDSLFAHLGPDFVDVYDPDLVTVAHIDASDASVQTLIDYWGFFAPTFPILTMGSTLFADWCEDYVPHTVIVDPIGVVRGNWIGFYPPFFGQMHEVIEASINPTGLYVGDLSLSMTSGDGDEILEPGESANLTITLDNLGQLNVSGVSAELLSQTDHVTVTQGMSTYPDFLFGTSHVNDQVLAISVDAEAPDAFDPPFQLLLTTDQGDAALRFALSVGERLPYWTVDCEGPVEAWTHAATAGWNDVWHLSTESSHSPTHAWKAGSSGTGTYGNHDDCRLVSPPIVLQDWSRLAFQHRMDAETSGAFPDSAYDGGVVEISTDDGANWTQLMPMTPYPNAFRAQSGGGNPASHNFPGQTPCYSGIFSWEEAVFDLADFNGQTVRLGFHFGSDNGGALEGWYVDDLVLAAPTDDTSLPEFSPRPATLALSAWPNPFNPGTLLSWNQPQAGPARLELYDLAGRLVRSLASGEQAAGVHTLRLEGAGLASGLYLATLSTPMETRILKVLLLR